MSDWSSMSPEQKARHSARSRAWRKANPEAANAIQRRSDRKNPARVRNSCRRWRLKNVEKDRLRKKAWRAANPHKQAEYHRRRYDADPEAQRARSRSWGRANPDKVNARTSKRRARLKKVAVPLTPQEQAEVIAIYAKARALTELVGEPYHVDHIKPISKGGLHHPSNLQVLRGIDNLRKGNRV